MKKSKDWQRKKGFFVLNRLRRNIPVYSEREVQKDISEVLENIRQNEENHKGGSIKALKSINKAIKILKKGGVGIFPTETAYGIGCRLDDQAAVQRLIKIRGRAKNKPFLVLVSSHGMARQYWQKLPPDVEKLAKKYWPGPLTIVFFCQKDKVPVEVRANGKTLAIRLPDYEITRQLIAGVGKPLLAPSANLAGETAPFRLNEINPKLLKAVDFVLNFPCGRYKQVSTVIDCSQKPWQTLRKGAIK